MTDTIDASMRSPVAYFSMEIALEPGIPTYSGGLGVLAGDMLRAAADEGVAMLGMTLLHRKGYFRQRLDSHGKQSEQPCEWKPDEHLERLDARVSVSLADRRVWLRAWRFQLRGIQGQVVPVYLLDTSLDDNGPWERTLTDHLYGGDAAYRLCQEAILGIGGVAMLRALGYQRIARYHMNEGHSALLALALLDETLVHRAREAPKKADIDAVRRRCVFTTHTPVPAGHDKFAMERV